MLRQDVLRFPMRPDAVCGRKPGWRDGAETRPDDD